MRHLFYRLNARRLASSRTDSYSTSANLRLTSGHSRRNARVCLLATRRKRTTRGRTYNARKQPAPTVRTSPDAKESPLVDLGNRRRTRRRETGAGPYSTRCEKTAYL